MTDPIVIVSAVRTPMGGFQGDLKGLKVRILDGVMAKFMEKVGATPVTMAFGEVAQGLSLGTIDCAVTGPSSANYAGWPESVTHVYPLALQVAVQGYGVNLTTWNKMTPDQQQKLMAAFGKLEKDISFALRRGTIAQVTTHALDGYARPARARPSRMGEGATRRDVNEAARFVGFE